ncbi:MULTISPECIES: DUF6492 family protein [unclassified Sphingomonas]|uniref:DUF6492 family protein n=1 Tax=unclassified Sphingomonas TaxID=196159 RepID=UPI0006F52429|nr:MULTISPECIES: DUF6492 family protein [unclassified Sphingomonas]KQM63546.1 hypothetical protein ASE65_16990 [Sphingomonas sp. Leaf16]KQN15162.1 hypothetical protein ASE81_17005 [Sphingomonas sp. Leaf29]KQN20697.1 hypothetical protein ASE83_16970 [Sphingomonas sp. Leaf32]
MLPLVICAGPRALPTAAVASRYYAADGIPAIVIRPAAYADHDARFEPGTHCIDDEALAGVESVSAYLRGQRERLASFDRAPGWFLQQFIKLAAVAMLDTDYVFIADGDTVFSRRLLRDMLTQPAIMTTGEQYANYDRLLAALGLAPPERSCVANGNIFPRDPLLRRLATPEGFMSILEDHIFPSRGALDFSEYQLTGSLLQSHLAMRRIKMFRRFDLLIDNLDDIPAAFVERALRRYDAIAIEANHHRSLARQVAARIFYGIGRSW